MGNSIYCVEKNIAACFWYSAELIQIPIKYSKYKRSLVNWKLCVSANAHIASLSYTCMHSGIILYVTYHDESMCNSTMWPSVCAFLCYCCLRSGLPLRVSQVCICTLACICLSACISANISQKQHITQLSLHPKEGPFHSKMLLVELRRIFLTVSLTLCWQTEKHPHIPKQCRE